MPKPGDIAPRSLVLEYRCEPRLQRKSRGEHALWCPQCDRTLYDLREMNRPELVSFIESKNGDVCGVFYEDQFDAIHPVVQYKRRTGLAALVAAMVWWTGTTHAATPNPESISFSPPFAQTTGITADSDEQELIVSPTKPKQAIEADQEKLLPMPWVIKRTKKRIIYMSIRFPFIHFKKYPRIIRHGVPAMYL